MSGGRGRGRGRGRVARGRPSGGPAPMAGDDAAAAGAAAGAAASSGGASAEAKVTQKVNGTFRMLSSMEMDVLLDPVTQQTLRQRLTADVARRERGARRKGHTNHTHNTQSTFFITNR